MCACFTKVVFLVHVLLVLSSSAMKGGSWIMFPEIMKKQQLYGNYLQKRIICCNAGPAIPVHSWMLFHLHAYSSFVHDHALAVYLQWLFYIHRNVKSQTGTRHLQHLNGRRTELNQMQMLEWRRPPLQHWLC